MTNIDKTTTPMMPRYKAFCFDERLNNMLYTEDVRDDPFFDLQVFCFFVETCKWVIM